MLKNCGCIIFCIAFLFIIFFGGLFLFFKLKIPFLFDK